MATTNFARERDRWWRERIDDLRSLTPAAFAERYGVEPTAVCEARRKLCPEAVSGTPHFWWNTPVTVALLTGTTPIAEQAKALGVKPHVVRMLRTRLRRLGYTVPRLPSGKPAAR